MRRFETLFITDPELPEENRQALLERLTGIIESKDGYLIKYDEWGAKKLAYEVRKRKRGYYILADFCAEGSLIQELERVMRIDDRVLRYLTVKVDEDVDLEALKKSLAEEAAAKAEAERQAEEERARKEAEARERAEAAAAAAAAEEAAADKEEAAPEGEKEETPEAAEPTSDEEPEKAEQEG